MTKSLHQSPSSPLDLCIECNSFVSEKPIPLISTFTVFDKPNLFQTFTSTINSLFFYSFTLSLVSFFFYLIAEYHTTYGQLNILLQWPMANYQVPIKICLSALVKRAL